MHKLYPEVPDVYCDTGVEYPELREFILSKPNVVVLKPKAQSKITHKMEPISFVEVIKRYGYPAVSKEQSAFIQEYRDTHSDKVRQIRLKGNKYGRGKISKKWQKFIADDCDICIGDKCCDILKKHPAERYEKETGLHPYIGTMTEESEQRKSNWIKYGCNAFSKKRSTSHPLSFWTKSDILEYIVKNNLPYAPVYGQIVECDGKYTTTGCDRTGCIFCAFGCHLEPHPNKFQKLAITHPNLYDYAMRGGAYNADGYWIPDKGLGLAKVLDFMGVEWWNDEATRDKYRIAYQEIEKQFK